MACGRLKIHIVAVGKIKEAYFREAIEEYSKRIGRFATFDIIEVGDVADAGEANAEVQQNTEGESILKKLKGYVVLLDLKGKQVSSEELAAELGSRAAEGKGEFSFVVGGSRGVSSAIKTAADCAVAFGRITYPHQLMRVILTEQIYRALTILNNVSYHK